MACRDRGCGLRALTQHSAPVVSATETRSLQCMFAMGVPGARRDCSARVGRDLNSKSVLQQGEYFDIARDALRIARTDAALSIR